MFVFFRLKPLALAFATRVLLGSTVAAVLSMPIAAQVQAREADFNIPAQSLDRALQEFGRQSDMQLLYNPSSVARLHSNTVQGRLEVTAALDALLTNTGVTYQQKGNTFTLSAGAASDTVLKTIQVRDNLLATTTEGTRSYTTRATSAATGLTLSPRETPQSVSVITRQRIDDQGMLTLSDVLSNAPGIATLQLDSERTTFSARGFSIDDFQYDGISSYYKSNYSAGESDLDSIIYDRIEIVRGATGLLTGAGKPSASINLVRKRADSREAKGEISVLTGSWDHYRGTVDVSAPLTQDASVRGRFVAAHEDKKSFMDRYERTKNVVHGVIEADLTSATTLSLGASYQKTDANGLTYGGFPLWYTDGTHTNFSRSFTVAPKWNQEDVEILNTYVNIDHQFENGWMASARAMYNKNKVDNTRLFLWGFPDPATGLVTDEPSQVQFPGERKQTSVDARLAGPFELAGREHEAIIGFSHFDHKYGFDWIGASTPWQSPISVYDVAHVAEPAWDYASRELSEKNHTKQSAVYGAVRFSIADPLKVIVGGRYTEAHRDGAGWASLYDIYDYDKKKFIPYAGIVYDFTKNFSAYASYTSIFNFQDYRDRDGKWLAPIEGDAYELGLKGEFFDGGLSASLALFEIEQDKLGQQDEDGTMVPGTDSPAYHATDGATSKGVELEVSGQLATGWNLFFFATQYKAEDSDDKDVNTYLPRKIVRLFTTYRLPGHWNQLTIGGGANWQSDIYYDSVGPNGERQTQGGYLLGNLMARYEITPQLSAQVNVYNLFDKEYMTSINWYGQGTWGTPRNWQAELHYKF